VFTLAKQTLSQAPKHGRLGKLTWKDSISLNAFRKTDCKRKNYLDNEEINTAILRTSDLEGVHEDPKVKKSLMRHRRSQDNTATCRGYA
jgi:hypothetical protein